MLSPTPLCRLLPLVLAVAAVAAGGPQDAPDPPLAAASAAGDGWSEDSSAGVGRLRLQPDGAADTPSRPAHTGTGCGPTGRCGDGIGAVAAAAAAAAPSSGPAELSVDDSSMKLLIQLVHNPTQWERLKQTLNRVPYTGALAGLVAHSRFAAVPTTAAPPGRYLRWRPDRRARPVSPAAAARRLVFRRGRWPSGDGRRSHAVMMVSRAGGEGAGRTQT